jgi:hypothetical protein
VPTIDSGARVGKVKGRDGSPLSRDDQSRITSLAITTSINGRGKGSPKDLRRVHCDERSWARAGLIPVLVEAAPTHYRPRNAEACDKAECNDQFQINDEIAGHGRGLGVGLDR